MISPSLQNIIDDIPWDFALGIGSIEDVIENVKGERGLKVLIEDLSQGAKLDDLFDYACNPLKLRELIYHDDIFAGNPRIEIIPNKVKPQNIVKESENLRRIADAIVNNKDVNNEELLEKQLEYYFKAFMAISPCNTPFLVSNVIIASLGYYTLAEYYLIVQ